MGVSASKLLESLNMPPKGSPSKTVTSEVTTRLWSDAPSELLSLITDRLGLIELLSFRGVCKNWRSASSTASALIESSPNHEPWFLLYGGNSKCLLYTKSGQKYTIDIPELGGTTCIASNGGWLLLFQEGSVFFFCPFSRAKVDLPRLTHTELSNHVAVFSSLPTSQECIVAVIYRTDQFNLELNVLHRGDNTWTTYEYSHPAKYMGTIVCGTYHDGTFYYLDSNNKALTFSLEDKRWVVYRVMGPKYQSTNHQLLPFAFSKHRFLDKNMKESLELEEDVSVSTCGTLVSCDKYGLYIFNESVEAPKNSESCHLKGVWFEPRFLQLPSNQSWCL